MTRAAVRVFGALVSGGVVVTRAAYAQDGARAAPIADNSFLIEEAYNQERGVVQHISTVFWPRGSGSWVYAFTQEWPIAGQRHQLSYTLPVVHRAAGNPGGTRVGDVAVNYRYQLIGTDGSVSVAPRVTIIAPTGSAAAGAGAGGVGLQVNLPVSAAVASWLVTHGNAGFTLTPSAANGAGDRATSTGFNLGASVIWLPLPALNVMLEVAWSHTETVVGPGATAAERQLLVSPGVRWAHNVAGGLQIVPGIAFPFGVGPSRGIDAVFFYLSFEHPFRRVAP
jgi:hypothetical protein